MKNQEQELFLTPEEACRLLSISRKTLTKLVQEDQLPACRVGGSIRLHLDSLLAWILARGNSAQQRVLRESGLFKQELEEADRERLINGK